MTSISLSDILEHEKKLFVSVFPVDRRQREAGMKSKKKSKTNSLVVKNMRAQGVYDRIRKIIEDARGNIARAVNTEMVIAYWQIGKEIVDGEQQGKSRADYGRKLLEGLVKRLLDNFWE